MAGSTQAATLLYEMSTAKSVDGYDSSKVAMFTETNVNGSALPTTVGLNQFSNNADWTGATGGFDISADNGTTLDNSTEFATGYLSFTVSAEAGFKLNLTTLDFGVGRGGTSGVRGYAMYAAVNGGAFSYADTPIKIVSPDTTSLRTATVATSVDLSGATYQGIDSVTFRWYSLTDSGGRTIGFDAMSLNGDLAAVPEPAVAGLIGLGVLGGLLIRRKRNR